MKVSIIVPVLNEEPALAKLLPRLRELNGDKEIVVVDGESDDRSVAVARSFDARVLQAPRGRGHQLHAGAVAARGDVLWFVHADSSPDSGALQAIASALSHSGVAGGNFSVVFDGDHRAARQMTWLYAKLGALGLAYGDSGIFVRRAAYDAVGGFRQIRLFEDVDFIRRIRTAGQFQTLRSQIGTSSRRFAGRYPRVWALWITLQLLYWAGVSPDWLARWYRPAR